MAFEYRYLCSIDEGIISRYNFIGSLKILLEIRTNFIVKDRDGVERIIDSERYAVGETKYRKKQIATSMGRRLWHYFMPGETIKRLIDEVMIFVKEIVLGGGRGKIPVGVDVEVCTVQGEGEGIEATVDRAMRPEYLPPLYIYPMKYYANPVYERRPRFGSREVLLMQQHMEDFAIRVEDVEKGLGVMEVCPICARKPMIGTELSLLRCGHSFHYHCIVRCFVSDISCPVCHLPAGDPGSHFPTRSNRLYYYDASDDHELELSDLE